jgi:ATP-binding cassette, subfamily B, multidrug efflux pump
MRKLLKFLKPYRAQCIIAPLFKFLEACFEIIVPILMKVIIDEGIPNGDTTLIYKYIILILCMGVLGLTVSCISQYFSAVAGMGMGTVLRREAFSHLNTLTNKDIDELGASTLVTRLTSDINQVSTGVNRFLRLFLRSPFIIIGTVVMSFIIDVYMGIIVLASVPLILLIIWFVSKVTVPSYKDIQKDVDNVSLKSKENLEGIRVIRAFSRQNDEQEAFDKTINSVSKKQIKVARVSSLLNPLTYAVTNIAIVVVLWLGGGFVNKGRLTAGEITAIVNYLIQILNAVVMLSNLVVILAKTQASAIRVSDFLDTKPSFNDEGNLFIEVDETKPKIEFKNVDFAYNENKLVLENLNFTIKKGETIGIIGGTGSGKTSLINLIPRLYDVTDGEILINGVNVKKYTFNQLWSEVAIAVQHSTLFKGTIRSNLKIANKDASDEDMYRALKIAQAYDFVMEKQGLDTEVAAKGANFSGGQKQRLNIARAVVQNPKILILDDSSSALDYATDLELRRSLKSLEGLTTIIVSQRVASVLQADKIIVLDDGKVAGIGSHDELLGTNTVYTEIYESQTRKEDSNEKV